MSEDEDQAARVLGQIAEALEISHDALFARDEQTDQNVSMDILEAVALISNISDPLARRACLTLMKEFSEAVRN